MNIKDLFRGQVSFGNDQELENKVYSLKYNISHDSQLPLSKKLITNFSKIGLTKREKQLLSRREREFILNFQNLEDEIIESYSRKLISKINAHPEDHIYIEASSFGSYICLAALFSGELDHQKELTFDLKATPLSLFPKKLIKQKKIPFGHRVTFFINPKCWLRPFASLYQCPYYMNLTPIYEDDDFEEHKVAS